MSSTMEQMIYLSRAISERDLLKRLNKAIIAYTNDASKENLNQLNGFLMLSSLRFCYSEIPVHELIEQYKEHKNRYEFFNPNKN